MIVKVLCSALLFLAFGTIARGEPRFDHTIRHVNVYRTTKLNVNITETTFHIDDETLPYLESKQIDEMIGVANQREFRVSDIMKTLRAGQEPQDVSSEEQDNPAEPEQGSDGPQQGSDGRSNGPQQGPDGPQQGPDGPQQGPDGQQQSPDGPQLGRNGSQQDPDESQQDPDGSQQGPDGPQQGPDGPQQGPDGQQQSPDGPQLGRNGSQQDPDESQQDPDGSQQDPDGSQQGPDGSELGSDALTGEADQVEDNGQKGNSDGQENTGEVSDDTVDQKNGDDANNNVEDQDGGENDNNPDKEIDATIDEDQKGDEEPDAYDDDNDYDDEDPDDIGDEKRHRDKKKGPRSKQDNRSKSGERQRSQGKSKPTKNSPNSRSNQKPPQSSQPKQTSPNSQINPTSQNSQPNQQTGNTQPSRKPGDTRTDQKSPASRPKEGTTNNQRQSTKRTSSGSRITKQRRVGTKRFKGGRRGLRLHGLRGRSSVFRKIRDETLRNYPKNNLRDPKNGNPPSETLISNDPRNRIPFSAGGGQTIVAGGGTGGAGVGGVAVGGGGGGAAALGTAASGAGSIGAPILVSIGGSILKKVADLATPDVNSGIGGDRRSYQPPKSPVDIHSNNRNTNNKRPGYPDKVNLNDRRGPQGNRVDPNNGNANNRQPGQAGKDDHYNLSPGENLPDQNGEDDPNASNSNDPETTQNGEDDIGVPNSDHPELTEQDEDDPGNLSPNEDFSNDLGEDDHEEINLNEDLSHQHSQQGETGFDNRKPSNRPLTQPNDSDDYLNEEDSDEQEPGVIFEDYSPHSVQETTKKTNRPEQSPTALAQADIELEKDLFRIIHHGDHMNITINDFFGRPPRVNGAGKKCIRKNTHVDTLDYDPAVPIPGRNRFCEPQNKLVNKFTVPPQCCGPQFACPLYIQYTGPGTGIDTAKNLAIQRDCRCELDFYKCLEENRDPAEMHPFFLFLHDSCLIKKADVSNTQPIGFRVINTAEFIAFPMYN